MEVEAVGVEVHSVSNVRQASHAAKKSEKHSLSSRGAQHIAADTTLISYSDD